MTQTPEGFEPRWSSWLLDRNRRGTRTLLWIVLSLYPAFGILDYLVAPANALPFLYGTRVLVTATTLAMFRVLKSAFFERHANLVSSVYMLLCSFGISLMTVFMGGLASPYYAGLTLAIVATGLLFVWPTPVVVWTHCTIVVSFIVPNVLLPFTADLFASGSNLAFLISTGIIAGTGQVLGFRSQRQQVLSQMVVEETKAHLEQVHEQLKQLDRFKSQFFANITHELKTPLTMILAPLELMLSGQLGKFSEAQRASLQALFKNGLKLLKMIGDLLDLSKLEESRLRLKIAENDLVEYLRGLVGQVEPLAQRKRIELSFRPAVERAAVWCELERMERVFVNLLSNAAKFTPIGGHIWVDLAEEDGLVRVTVKDDGPGFPSAMVERVFERFFQADMAGTRKHGGTGIGLALAKELVELHGGRIWAESDLGKGATFVVELKKGRDHFGADVLDRRAQDRDRPDGKRESDRGVGDWAVQLGARDDFRMLDIDEATESRVVDRDEDEDQRAYTVLVIEDTPDVIRVIHAALRQELKVIAAPDGLKGLEMAVRELPSLIITDLMMPEIDGLEVVRRLRGDARTRHIPIVMLTARGDLDDRLAGLETGVNAYLAKPFSAKELLSTVRSLLNTQESTADLLLAQRMDSLETITGGLAHEINNPLNYVKNALDMIRRDIGKLTDLARSGGDPAPVQRRMQKMFEAAESGVKRIGGTVDLMGRYSREGYSHALVAHDMFTAARDVAALVVPSIGYEVKVETSFTGEGTVDCIPHELNQVLTNLIQNAVEAAPADGTAVVRITGSNADGAVVLSVRDNGPGIKPEDRRKIFTPFFSTKGPGRGMGLGLTITWRVVQSLGGSIKVNSKVGEGTEFVVRIQRSRAAAVRPVSAAKAYAEARA